MISKLQRLSCHGSRCLVMLKRDQLDWAWDWKTRLEECDWTWRLSLRLENWIEWHSLAECKLAVLDTVIMGLFSTERGKRDVNTSKWSLSTHTCAECTTHSIYGVWVLRFRFDVGSYCYSADTLRPCWYQLNNTLPHSLFWCRPVGIICKKPNYQCW